MSRGRGSREPAGRHRGGVSRPPRDGGAPTFDGCGPTRPAAVWPRLGCRRPRRSRAWTRGVGPLPRGADGLTRGSGFLTRGAGPLTHGRVSLTHGSDFLTHGSACLTRGSALLTRGAERSRTGQEARLAEAEPPAPCATPIRHVARLLRGGHRAGGPRPAPHRDEDALPLPEPLRRGALSGLPRVPGTLPVPEPARGGPGSLRVSGRSTQRGILQLGVASRHLPVI